MTPLQLTMRAFGPFSGEHTLTFSDFGENPFFLINGTTGSGKSSILDAICYALYGQTTGDERTGEQMRCDFASLDTDTWVSFMFLLGDKHYRIERSPEQTLAKKRGEGTTKRAHSVQFYRVENGNDIVIANKAAQVNQEISSLLGLNAKQFRQVMVIPQGKFRELLLANSREREDILGQLFGTEVYRLIEQKLLEQSSGIRKEKEQLDAQLQGALDVVNVSDEDELVSRLASIKEQSQIAEDSWQQQMRNVEVARQRLDAQIHIEKRFVHLEVLNKSKQSLINDAPWLADAKQTLSFAEHALSLHPAFNRFETSARELADTRQVKEQKTNQRQQCADDVERLKIEKQAVDSLQQELPNLRAKTVGLTQSIDTLEQISMLKQSILDLEGKKVAKEQRHAALNAELTSIDAKHQNLQKQLLGMQSELKALPTLLRRQNIANQYRELYRSREKHTQTGLSLKKQHQELESLCQLSSQALDTKRTVYLQGKLRWHTNIAAQLASELSDNQPCMVCGSKVHPQLAEYSGDVITEDSLKELEDKFDVANVKYQRLVAQRNEKSDSISRWMQESLDIENKVSEFLANWPEAENEDLSALDNAIEQLNALKTNDLEKQIETVLQQRENLVQSEKVIEADMSKVLLLLAEKSSELKVKLASVPSELNDIEQAKRQLRDTETKIIQYEQKISSINSDFEQINKALLIVETELKSLIAQLEKQSKVHQETVIEWQCLISESVFTDQAHWQQSLLSQEEMASLKKQITTYEANVFEVEANIKAVTKELADSERPNLPTFEVALNDAQAIANQLKSTADGLRSEREQLINVTKHIDKIKADNQKLEQTYQVIGTLSDVASGKNSQRLSLHRFVLGVLLDDVLIQASMRLEKMSRGRYRLLRNEERSKGNASSGLSLIVEDAYTGKTRDVATLSGGESFIAALSLALGLSEVVQSYSGGVRLDTLFIDEGFGSLDQDALELAIETLLELQRAGRTIGIISHVSELKEQFECRVDVIAGKLGSSLRLNKLHL